MIAVTKQEKELLEDAGLLQLKKHSFEDQNFVVVNKKHKSRQKNYFVVEEPEILLFLGRYDNFNLQKIWPNQMEKLIREGLIKQNQIQKWHTYVPNALAFEDGNGQWRIKKIQSLMLFLGIWKKREPITTQA